MADHTGVPIANPAGSSAYRQATRQPGDIGIWMAFPARETGGGARIGFATGSKPCLRTGVDHGNLGRICVALTASMHADVDAFPAATRALRRRDKGAPGVRPHHHEHDCGGVVPDPEGHDIEANCRRTEA